MSKSFWDKVQKRAYYKYLNKKQYNLPDNSYENWTEAAKEEKIAEEAYFNYTKGYDDSDLNWEFAKNDVLDRIRFLAFYAHEKNIDKSSEENWQEAQKIYVENF